jgi:N-acetyl-anhydromuramyl-L-alanine amidase AmpD
MGSVERITVHHSGLRDPNWSVDEADVADDILTIQHGHFARLRAGDIGYHYIIDRKGRVWQGRDIRFQGAHVRNNNPHNIGVMCLGNFDIQEPSRAQVATLERFLAQLGREHGLGPVRIFTHQELVPTTCPGRALQARMGPIRRNLRRLA